MIDQRDQDRDDRPRLAETGGQRQLAGASRSDRVPRRRSPSGSDAIGRIGVPGHRPMVLFVAGSAHGSSRTSFDSGLGGGPTRPLPRARWMSLASGVQARITRLARPGISSTPAQRGEQAGRRARIAVEAGVGDRHLQDGVGVRDGDAGQAVLRGRIRPLARCRRRPAGRCASRPSRRSRRSPPSRGSRSSDPRRRSNGCGSPDEATLRAGRRDRLGRRQARRDRLLQEEADEVAVAGPHLFADDDGQAGRRQRASLQRAVDPIVVGDRQVRQPPIGRRPHDGLRRRQAVEARPRMAMQIDERRARHDWSESRRGVAGAGGRSRAAGLPAGRRSAAAAQASGGKSRRPTRDRRRRHQICWTRDFLKKS